MSVLDFLDKQIQVKMAEHMGNRNLMQFNLNPKNKTQIEEGVGNEKEKENRSKQTRPFTSKVAKK